MQAYLTRHIHGVSQRELQCVTASEFSIYERRTNLSPHISKNKPQSHPNSAECAWCIHRLANIKMSLNRLSFHKFLLFFFLLMFHSNSSNSGFNITPLKFSSLVSTKTLVQADHLETRFMISCDEKKALKQTPLKEVQEHNLILETPVICRVMITLSAQSSERFFSKSRQCQ